jgi:hypothetical protein
MTTSFQILTNSWLMTTCQSPSTLYCLCKETEYWSWVVSTSALYSGGLGFKSWPRDWLSWPRCFCVSQFLQVNPRIVPHIIKTAIFPTHHHENLKSYLTLGHKHFLTYHFKSIIYQSSYHLTSCNLSYWQHSLINHK